MESMPKGSVMSQFDSSENVLNMNLSVLEPRKVVEVYIKRSLSLAEAGAKHKKIKWRSLPENGSPRNMKCKGGSGLHRRWIHHRAQGRQLNEQESQNHGDKVVPSGSNSSNVDSGVEKAASKGKSKEGRKRVTIQTFFERVVNFLWKRKGDEKEGDGQNEVKEPGPLQAENPPECNGQQHLANNKEPPREMSSIRKLRKWSSQRRFSFSKRRNSEVKNIGSGSSKGTEVQPNLQDLKDGCKLKPEKVSEDPSDQVSEDVKWTLESNKENEHVSEDPSDQVSEQVKQTLESNEENDDKQNNRRAAEVLEAQSLDESEQDTEYLYEQVSEEVEQYVRALESSEENKERRKSRTAELLEAQNLDESDDRTWKIIQLLQNVGDRIDLQLHESSQLSTFFTNISYNAFKELADQYIKEEVKNKGPQENLEIMQLAFTLDFTAKVAVTCVHQIKQITGFGSQYLQDTCWHLLQ